MLPIQSTALAGRLEVKPLLDVAFLRPRLLCQSLFSVILVDEVINNGA